MNHVWKPLALACMLLGQVSLWLALLSSVDNHQQSNPDLALACQDGEEESAGKAGVAGLLFVKFWPWSNAQAMEQYSYAPPLLSPSEDHQATPSYCHCRVAVGCVRLGKRNAWAGWEQQACCLSGLGIGVKAMLKLPWPHTALYRLVAMEQYSYAPPPLSPSEDHQATPSYCQCGVAVGQSILIWHQACQVGEEEYMGRAGVASLLFVGSLPWGGTLDIKLMHANPGIKEAQHSAMAWLR
ncbi:hypothetical protein EI94DRAFT_1708157 [Lactarius quietus]|nr:hypothetical protein EI94DRAFT_1708157 [Lactarius quietus]